MLVFLSRLCTLLPQMQLLELEQARSDLWISRQVLREYLATLTRPEAFTETIPIAAIIEEIRFFPNTISCC